MNDENGFMNRADVAGRMKRGEAGPTDGATLWLAVQPVSGDNFIRLTGTFIAILIPAFRSLRCNRHRIR